MVRTCESHGSSNGSHLQHWPEVNATKIESALLRRQPLFWSTSLLARLVAFIFSLTRGDQYKSMMVHVEGLWQWNHSGFA